MMSRALLIARSRAAALQSSRSGLIKSQGWGSRYNSCGIPTLFSGSFAYNHEQRACISLLASVSLDDHETESSPFPLSQHQQIRWKRKGGASAFTKPRPTPRKKLKQYNRRKKEQWYNKVGRHSAPGSKAGERREYFENEWNDLLEHDPNEPVDPKLLEYGIGDALVEDLMGNTAHLTSSPTPEPIYLGHRHKKFYNKVAEQMQQYKQAQLTMSSESTSSTEVSTDVQLPSDRDISLVLRAYRDRHGTKTKPIGIAKALEHLLKDLGIPTAAFGELTYTTLLTCCRTPREARRIFKLQTDQQHPISAYSWSILVDVHAKLGDFEGCNAVMEEMASEGVSPTLAAYTSLLAACFKVCNAGGRIPPSIRAQAGKLGWSKWKEMRIVGLEPDVMAYGAILRLCAARGQAERALSILEEMQTFGVKPTTLCFTSALKAVARSHQTAIRYERAFSKKNRRRELVTAHHGKLARSIVILAEDAQVEQDDGFVAALMLCAAAAGDSSTAKAILLASQVRRMDHLRTIGSNEHLQKLSGEAVEDELSGLLLTDGVAAESNKLATTSTSVSTQKKGRSFPSFEDREYGGNDTRTLSALLLACSQAAENRGLGDIWSGRENKGYLCDNSLRLITVRPTPKYVEERVPGMTYQEVARSAMVWDEEEPEEMGKRLRRSKFRGVDIDEDAGFTLDEMDEQIQQMFAPDQVNEPVDAHELVMGNEGKVEQHHIGMIEGTGTAYFDAATGSFHVNDGEQEETIEAASVDQETSDEPEEEWYFDADARKWKTRSKQPSKAFTTDTDGQGTSDEPQEEWYFNADARKWKTRSKQLSKASPTVTDDQETSDESQEEWYFDADARKWKTSSKQPSKTTPAVTKNAPVSKRDEETDKTQQQQEEKEFYFDANLMQWKTRSKASAQEAASADSMPVAGQQMVEAEADTVNLEHEFQLFFEGLKEEIRLSGEDIEVTEAEAREFFDQARQEESLGDLEPLSANLGEDTADIDPDEFDMFYDGLKDQIKESGENVTVSEKDARELFLMMRNEFNANKEEALPENDASALRTERSPPNKSIAEPADAEFEAFCEGLKQEAKALGADPDVDKHEARELFKMLKGDFSDGDGKLFADNDEDLIPGNDSLDWSKEQGTPRSLKMEDTDSEFDIFYESLKQEAQEVGSGSNIDVQEAQELFRMFKSEFSDDNEKLFAESTDDRELIPEQSPDKKTPSDFEEMFGQLKDEWGVKDIDLGDHLQENAIKNQDATTMAAPEEPVSYHESMLETVTEFDDHLGTQSRSVEEMFNPEMTPFASEMPTDQFQGKEVLFADDVMGPLAEDSFIDVASSPSLREGNVINMDSESALEMSTANTSVPRKERFEAMDKELAQMLPGLPASRIKKIRNVFLKTLGDPSMLRLVPLLRENMPDYVTPGWLKKKNLQNAAFCMKMARQDGLLDVHMLNGMLQVETSCGGLDRALQFHQEQFKRHKVKPTPYSDRLVLQMFVKSNRLERALQFKEKVEDAGRRLDIHSYGSIVEHYGKKGQLGSALLVIKECIQVHGSPPSEKSLSKVRLLCRQHDVEEEVGIVDLIGKDPVEWIRHGEANLKREMSYRGRRNVNLPRNRMVQI